jgi:hypothetical protein
LAGFLLVFLPVFWDTIPTLAAHRRYCEQEAGFHVYKTVEHWARENPGAKDVPPTGGAVIFRLPGGGVGYQINSGLRSETKSQRRSWGIHMRNESIVDSNTGEVLFQYLDFNTGITNIFAYGVRSLRDLKTWLKRDHCVADRDKSGLNEFAAMVERAKAIGGKR